jgi:hypothetical protein
VQPDQVQAVAHQETPIEHRIDCGLYHLRRRFIQPPENSGPKEQGLLNYQFDIVKGDGYGQRRGSLVKTDLHGARLTFLIRRNAGHRTFRISGKSVLRQLAQKTYCFSAV